ncbi:MAG: hypothetical protein OXC65_12720 [Thiotrichales bacterium]|nr:hypothetical protein [Thiotrichales bacterium]
MRVSAQDDRMISRVLQRAIPESISTRHGTASVSDSSKGRQPRNAPSFGTRNRVEPMEQQPLLAFDTHAAVVELVGSGMPERQAETVVRLQVSLMEQHFATKADIGTVNASIESSRAWSETEFEKVYASIESLRAWTEGEFEKVHASIESLRVSTEAQFASQRRETDARFESLRHEFKAEMASLKSDLIKWMIGTNLAFATLVIAAVKIFLQG